MSLRASSGLRGAVLEPAQESWAIERVQPDYSAENDDVTYDIQYVDSTGPADTKTCTSEVSLFIDYVVIQNNPLIAFS